MEKLREIILRNLETEVTIPGYLDQFEMIFPAS